MRHLQGMKRVTIRPSQAIFDITPQEYGIYEAVGIILKENEMLANGPAAKVATGIDADSDKGFYFDLPLETGAVIQIDTDNRLVRRGIIREVDKGVTTFNLQVMARSINEIQNGTITTAQKNLGMQFSVSRVAEWRIRTYIFAIAIHVLEITLDTFEVEIDTITNRITPGTVRWCAEVCYRFQNGYELKSDDSRAVLYYDKIDPQAQIIKVVAIREEKDSLVIKAAKQNHPDKIVPLLLEERRNFTAYIDVVKFTGVDTTIVSTSQDRIRHDLEVYFETSIPNILVHESVKKALDKSKASLGFDSIIYKQRFIDTVMDASGVVTCNLVSLERKGVTDDNFKTVDVFSVLGSGYFEYTDDYVLTLRSVEELES